MNMCDKCLDMYNEREQWKATASKRGFALNALLKRIKNLEINTIEDVKDFDELKQVALDYNES